MAPFPEKLLLAAPRGYCAGVDRAVQTVERALTLYGPPVYVRKEIVHNKHVVAQLRDRGAIFVDELDDSVPAGAHTVFSAHGVSEEVERGAAARGLTVIDATCPLVAKVHQEGRRYAGQGFEVVLIGHRGHPEVIGTMGQIPGRVHLVADLADVAALRPADSERLAYVTQTTLSVDDTREIIAALRRRFPSIVGPDTRDICYATQNRQASMRALAGECDVVLVVGARNSSNTNRLREIGQGLGVPSYLVQDSSEFDPHWLEGASSVGITAGASAPEELVQELLQRLRRWFAPTVETLSGVEEHVQFRLPDELVGQRRPRASAGAALPAPTMTARANRRRSEA